MAKVAWETKAEDILVLHVEPVVYWTRFMCVGGWCRVVLCVLLAGVVVGDAGKGGDACCTQRAVGCTLRCAGELQRTCVGSYVLTPASAARKRPLAAGRRGRVAWRARDAAARRRLPACLATSPPLVLLPPHHLPTRRLIATVFSRPQLNAILGKMTKEAEEAHGRRLSVNPTATCVGLGVCAMRCGGGD